MCKLKKQGDKICIIYKQYSVQEQLSAFFYGTKFYWNVTKLDNVSSR